MAAPDGSKKAVLAALLANTGIAVAKFVGFAITHSSSMLAESVHSVADAGNQGLLLFGASRAKRRADRDHPFGFGRERYFWAFVVSLVLFSLGALFAIYEGIEKLRHPHKVDSPAVAIAILLVGIVLETLSFRTAIVVARKLKAPDESWPGFLRRSRVPELPVVILEDLGALVGLVLALTGVSLAAGTGDPVWDACGTLSIGVLLGVIAVVLMVEMKSMLIGEGALPATVDSLTSALLADPDVRAVADLRTNHLGPDELLVVASVELRGDLIWPEVAGTFARIEESLRAVVPEARHIVLEPLRGSSRSSVAPANGSDHH